MKEPYIIMLILILIILKIIVTFIYLLTHEK